jgi:hypothetical protein
VKLNLPPKPPTGTWEDVLSTDYGRINKKWEEEILLAAATFSHAHVDPSLRSSAVEGNLVVLRNGSEVVTVCAIAEDGEMTSLAPERWPEKYRRS